MNSDKGHLSWVYFFELSGKTKIRSDRKILVEDHFWYHIAYAFFKKQIQHYKQLLLSGMRAGLNVERVGGIREF